MIAAGALLLLSAALALAAFVLPGLAANGPVKVVDPLAPVSPFDPPTNGAPLKPLPHPSRPTGLIIPALGVRAPVVPLHTEGEVLTPPGDVSEVGWWRAGRRPGSPRGNVLITGHTVHTGGGVFDNLGDLRIDDQIEVDTRTGPVVYQVVEVRYLSVAQLADEAPALFAHDGPSRLVLVTCAGWDGAQYEYHGNTVVIAQPIVTARHARLHPSRGTTGHPTHQPSYAASSPSTTAPTASPSTTAPTSSTSPTVPTQSPSGALEPPGLPYWYPRTAGPTIAPRTWSGRASPS